MLEILAITTPIFLIIGMGYVAMLLGIVGREQMQGIGNFVMYFALPALVVRALTQNPLKEVFNLAYLLAYGLGSVIVFTSALCLAIFIQKKNLQTGAIFALGMSVSNSAFTGYPVAAMVLGPPAVTFLALSMIVENLLMIPAALILAEMGRQAGGSLSRTLLQTANRMAKNPILMAILIGVLIAIVGLELPSPVTRAIDMVADAAGPAALFVIGGTLYGLHARGVMMDASQIMVGKLIFHPLAIVLAFLLMPATDPLLLAGAILFAAAPMASIYPLLGQRYGMADVAVGALMAATLASFVTFSVVIGLMTYFGLLT
ncbi:AEC family transporter [Vreelandella nigrificans]|uniref:Permease n=1 Tax=Vreelandella nigrificans TaxID=2042704 RepID=A0A2A4HHN6_9GAMM|nr:AEC family transporter [Halomonas nigrificans]PCF94300.1 permease [Halomonas nigrificans]